MSRSAEARRYRSQGPGKGPNRRRTRWLTRWRKRNQGPVDTRETTCDDGGRFAYLVCHRFPDAFDADTKECHDCHDRSGPRSRYIQPDEYWIYEDAEIGDSCDHCGVRIVDAGDLEDGE